MAFAIILRMKITARLYKPTKTAMSSGRAKCNRWKLEYMPLEKNAIEPLMGWMSGGTMQQIQLYFDTYEQALSHAHAKGLEVKVIAPQERKIKPRSYSANFAYDKRTAF